MKPTLYTITRRPKGAKWAHVDAYKIIQGALCHVVTLRYQPGSTPGHDHEVRRAYGEQWASTKPIDDRWEVREIEPNL